MTRTKPAPSPSLEERVLLLAPGREAGVAARVLVRVGIVTVTCVDMPDVCEKLEVGAGALLLTEETLAPRSAASLARCLDRQPPWSDVPIVVLTAGGETTTASLRAARRLGDRANVTLLERPVRSVTLAAAIRAALRARQRQYELRDHLSGRERASAERARLLADEQAARERAEEAERRARFLSEASRFFNASLDYEATLRNVAQLAVPFLADWCSIDVVGDDGAVRRVAVCHVDPAKAEIARRMKVYPPDPAGLHPRTRVLRTGRPELVAAVTDTGLAAIAGSAEQLEVMRQVGYRSAMFVPLVARGGTIGAITLASAESGRRYDADDLGLAEELAQRAALAVDNARLFDAERQARTAAEVANRAKDTFLATVSHELRTPLSPILAWARMLREGKLDADKASRALEIIERNARSQAQLIEDLLDVSRIIAGKLRLTLRPTDLRPVIQAALDVIRPAADAKGVRLSATLDPGVGRVSGDPERLQQVVWNLLSNAVKFTPKAGRVEVTLRRHGGLAEIAVRDTGKGITAGFLPFVFERFQQADSSASRVHAGLGLGLAIVRHIVELHGGNVRVESGGEGQGAAFFVELPLGLSAETPAPLSRVPARIAEGPAYPSLRQLRVLVVDDDPDSNEVISTLLASCGAEVRVAASAAQALDIARYWHGDVLVSDVAMPNGDGYSLIAELRKRPDGWRTAPAVALTAYAANEDRRRLLDAGFQVHVAKPIEPQDLVAIVADVARGAGKLVGE